MMMLPRSVDIIDKCDQTAVWTLKLQDPKAHSPASPNKYFPEYMYTHTISTAMPTIVRDHTHVLNLICELWTGLY